MLHAECLGPYSMPHQCPMLYQPVVAAIASHSKIESLFFLRFYLFIYLRERE